MFALRIEAIAREHVHSTVHLRRKTGPRIYVVADEVNQHWMKFDRAGKGQVSTLEDRKTKKGQREKEQVSCCCKMAFWGQ